MSWDTGPVYAAAAGGIGLFDLLKLGAAGQYLCRAFEPVSLSEIVVDDIEFTSLVVAQVFDGARRAQIGEHQVVIVPDCGGALGRKIWGTVCADSGHEAHPLLPDYPFHVVVQNSHVYLLGGRL